MEFMKMEDCPIPYLKLGYNSLFHFLRDIKEIKHSRDEFGNRVLVVEDERINHLNELIRNQKPLKVIEFYHSFNYLELLFTAAMD